MPPSSSPRETEIKLRIASVASIRRLLRQLGFVIESRRVFESNIILDTPDGELRRKDHLLRLRLAGRLYTLTFKGASLPGRYKSRDEIESELADPEALTVILAGLGYTPVFRYEKYRTVYHQPDRRGSVMLDETPVGDFLEIEGAPRSIDRIARDLGYSRNDYITASYGQLYLDHCRSAGATPRNMVFSARK